MKTKLTDSYGNDLLDENGEIQYKENKTMKTYTVTFNDNFKASNEDNAFEQVLNYLGECVNNGDVTAFNFQEEDKANIDKETIYYALSRLLDDDMSDDEFNYISDLRDRFSINKQEVNLAYAKEGYKACAICKEY